MKNSIKKQLVVEAPQERAFRAFTEKIERWWPPEHHIGKSAMKAVIIEPKADGRWYELCEDGSQCDWGKVLAWDPPRRLVLAWQLSAQFQYDPALITEVEVHFTPEGPRRTRVEFEHRNLDRFGPEALATLPMMDAGWGQILERYVATAATPEEQRA